MLPITSVVLFKHGVGYFERSGSICGEARVEMAFRASEMNDMLKPRTVLDLDGGEVTNIAYESTQPLSRQLEDFSFEIPENRAMSGLLGQLTGTAAVVHRPDGTSEGTIAGIERYQNKVGTEVVTGHRLALWVDGAALESHDLADVTRVELADPSLRKDLQHLLDILISAKKKDLKRLTIHTRGVDERTLTVSYVIETPVWKTSYRVLVYEGETQIQGWALVDNTQDEDWSSVQLTLVAGLPISFVHDLYSPRYQKRPEVRVVTEAAYAPPVLEQGMAEEAAAMDVMAMSAPGAPPAPAAYAGAGARGGPKRRAAPPPPQAKTVHTQEVGDLLHYEIATPVTVARKQSALVPILHRPFEGKRVAIYNAEVRDQNPMSAIWFKNTTGLTLEGGPLTVLEDGAYVGEAMLETIKPDEARIVPYSVELGCRIRRAHDDDTTEVHRVRIVDGRVHLIRYRIIETTYLVDNRNDAEIDLFLDHPFRPGYHLHETIEPMERTDTFVRFRFDAPAKKLSRLKVQEKGEQHETVAITDVDADRITLWFQQKYIGDEIRAALQHVAGLCAERAKVQRRIVATKAAVDDIFVHQKRLRENLAALGTAADERQLRQRYVADLSSQEDRIAELQRDADQYRSQADTLDRQIREAVAALDIDRPAGSVSSSSGA